MNWFWLALIPPFLWATSNHVDKYLLSRFVKGGGIGSLLIVSSFFGIFLLPVLYLFENAVFSISYENILILISAGVINCLAVYFYLNALSKSDASNAVPIFQTIPIFGFILAYLFLGERLTNYQIVGGIIIIFGAILISLDYNEHSKISLAKHTLVLMLLSSFTYSTYEFLFKYIALNQNFWISLFWEMIGFVIFGLAIYLFNEKYRDQFKQLITQNGKTLLILNTLNETINITGLFLFQYLTLITPLALVQLVGAYQPLYVFILGILIAKLWPQISNENLSRKIIIQKMFAILIILIGSYFIYL